MLKFGCFCLSEKPWSSGGIRSQENLVPCNGIIVGGGCSNSKDTEHSQLILPWGTGWEAQGVLV